MRKIYKNILLTFLSLIIYAGLVYISIAFIESKINCLLWQQSEKEKLIGLIWISFPFIPAIYFLLENKN